MSPFLVNPTPNPHVELSDYSSLRLPSGFPHWDLAGALLKTTKDCVMSFSTQGVLWWDLPQEMLLLKYVLLCQSFQGNKLDSLQSATQNCSTG